MKRTWREAATLIVIARDVSKNLKFDYKVLTFTRTDKTSFFPNSVCFPGGGIDKTDESQDWTSFFKNHNIPSEKLRNEPGIQRPFIYDKKEGRLERELSLRLTAIRETFEELGVVFCRDPSDQSSPFSSYYHSKVCDVPVWQNKIHNHETSLMAFCEKFNVVPDVMNIYEWSCWLTPTFFRPKRYETAFFLVALNDIPPVYPESHEVQDFQWATPDEILQSYSKRELWLPPPQFAEIRRLAEISSIDKLVEIAKAKKGQGMPTIMPMHFKAKDGFMHVIPGDDLYPETPNFFEGDHDIDKYADKTMEEMRAIAKNLNRSEQRDLFEVKFFSTVEGLDGKVSLNPDPISKM